MNNTKTKIDRRVEEIIFTNQDILDAIDKAAKWINTKMKKSKEKYMLVGILKGCVPFVGSILSKIEGDISLDFFAVTSYRAGIKQSSPKIVLDMAQDVSGKNIIILEDIVDTGQTLKFIIDLLKKRNAKSVLLVTLFSKPGALKNNLKIDYIGLNLPNKWVVGFGLDHNEFGRNLPYVGTLKKEYQK